MAEGEGVSAGEMAVEEEVSGVERKERGIDVSHWQGKIDWEKVAKTGIKHVCMKMSEGANYLDPSFMENWKGAKKAGFCIGCYHYFRGFGCHPEQQMGLIKKNTTAVNFDPNKNFLAIDVEEIGNEKATPLQMADNLNALLVLLKKDPILSRSRILIYTSPNYWNHKVKWDKYNFSAFPLWVAHWEAQDPQIPEPWNNRGKTWSWWQYSSKGKVDGINGPVDLDWVKL